MYQVLARKWRPKTFKELVGQKHVAQALTYALENKKIHHAYLFTGTRGVGKTTIARIYAKSLNCITNGISANPCGVCENCREIDQGHFPDLIEIDAASRRGIDETRDLLDNVPYAPSKGRYKVYLIDEVHMFTRESFNALLKTLEEPPEHVKFILATTDPQKMPATVLSRCLQFHLKNLSKVQIAKHLEYILEKENITFENDGLSLIAEAANGSMRDSLSILDQAIAFGMGKVLTQEVANLLGAIPIMQIHELYRALVEGDALLMRKYLNDIGEFSPDYTDLFKRFLLVMQQITICQLHAQRAEDEIPEVVVDLAKKVSVETVQLWYQIGTETWQSFVYQPDARNALEMMLLRMIALKPLMPDAALENEEAGTESEAKTRETVTDINKEVLVESDQRLEMMPPSSKEVLVEGDPNVETPPSAINDTNELAQERSAVEAESVDSEKAKKKVDLATFINSPVDWSVFLSQLPFDGEMTKEFMQSSCPVAFANSELQLAVSDVSIQGILTNQTNKIEALISEATGENVRISFIFDQSAVTPSVHFEKVAQTEKMDAQAKFESLPIVQGFKEELNGRTIHETIKQLK